MLLSRMKSLLKICFGIPKRYFLGDYIRYGIPMRFFTAILLSGPFTMIFYLFLSFAFERRVTVSLPLELAIVTVISFISSLSDCGLTGLGSSSLSSSK